VGYNLTSSIQGVKSLFRHVIQQQTLLSLDEMCCLSITSKDVSLIHTRRNEDKIELLDSVSLTYSESNLLSSLTEIVKTYHLEKVPCIWMLQPTDYQLLLVEALPVKADEFQAAIRWKIKDLLSFPAADAVIESFPLPLKKTADSKEMIMVVAARKHYLQTLTEKIQQSGLQLQAIDIPELALKNITSLYEKDNNKGTVLIYLNEKQSLVIVSYQQVLYLVRQLEFGWSEVNSSHFSEAEISIYLDKLALEIQRSFDYFKSQWRQQALLRVMVVPSKPLPMNIEVNLSQRLHLSFEKLQLTDYGFSQLSLEQQEKFLLLLGGALRTVEEPQYAPAN